MAAAVGKLFLIKPSSSVVCKNINKSSLGITSTVRPAKLGTKRQITSSVVRAQQRPTWLPGLDPPPYLDGT